MFDMLQGVASFIQEERWSTYRKLPEFLRCMKENVKHEEGGAALGISKDSYRALNYDLSNALYTIFGADFFTRVNANDLEGVRARIAASTVRDLYELFPRELILSIKNRVSGTGEINSIVEDLSGYKNELEFLSQFSKMQQELSLSKVNPQKVSDLLGALEGTGIHQIKVDIVNQLQAGVS